MRGTTYSFGRVPIGEWLPMRSAEKKRATITSTRRRVGLKTEARDKEQENPFRKLRGVAARRVEVDRYLDSIRGR